MIYLKRFQYLLELLLCVVVVPFILLSGGIGSIYRGEVDGLDSLIYDFLNRIFK
jgi:hypothetical protein